MRQRQGDSRTVRAVLPDPLAPEFVDAGWFASRRGDGYTLLERTDDQVAQALAMFSRGSIAA